METLYTKLYFADNCFDWNKHFTLKAEFPWSSTKPQKEQDLCGDKAYKQVCVLIIFQ